jgi:3-phenylpropionate/trans-cinnamate dioxygenase ferredoxin reductase subunit
MSSSDTFVIVGAGMAGGKAVETLRAEGFDGRVVLLGAEPHRPYERPPLSKDYLRGEGGPAWLQEDEGWYAQNDVDLRTSTVVQSIDAGERAVVLSGGERIGFDRLLFATGAEPRRLPIEGADLDGVHLLRTIEDSDAIRATFDTGGRLVVIGGGWIGCEVAASARRLGVDVALVEQAPAPMHGVLGRELGEWFAALHRDHGVHLHLGAGVHRLDGAGRVEAVALADGRVLEAAVVVLGVGVAPDTRLAAAAGLTVANGIVTDELLRAAPGIYAAGDVAGVWHPRYGRHVRVEHWSNALHQGTGAGASMLGDGTPYDRVPYFFSDQYDAGLEYVGLHGPADRLVVRGNLDAAVFQAFWVSETGRVTAGMHVNDWEAMGPIRSLVESGAAVDADALADAGTSLEDARSAPA